MILTKGWFSDLETLEIYGQVNSEKISNDPPTKFETLNTQKQELK